VRLRPPIPPPPTRIAVLAFLAAFLMAQACFPRAVSAQGIQGLVLDAATGEPIPAAVVTVRDTAGNVVARAEAARSGRFVVSLPRPDRYRIGAERIGYGAAEADRVFEVGPDEVLDLDLRLSAEPVALDAVVATARSRRARQSVVRGTPLRLLDRADIEDLEVHDGARAVRDLARHVPGVRVVEYPTPFGMAACIEVQRKAAAGCAGPLIVVDGIPVDNGDLLAYEMASQDVESIEVLRASEAGVLYGTLGGRGVVLINTRGTGEWSSSRRAAAIPIEERGTRELALGGAAVGLGGVVVASLASCLTLDCPFGEVSRETGAMELSALSLAIPVGVHVAGGRRSSLLLQALASTAVGAAGYAVWAGTDRNVVLFLTPVVQVAGSLLVEKWTRGR